MAKTTPNRLLSYVVDRRLEDPMYAFHSDSLHSTFTETENSKRIFTFPPHRAYPAINK